MRLKVLGCALFFSLALLGGQSAARVDKCTPRGDDPKGYLLKICRYIVNNKIDVAPADPNKYKIKGIHDSKYEDKEAYMVELDCCYMGDIAYIDKKSGEVIAFELGIK
jgi:hypothetical protein